MPSHNKERPNLAEIRFRKILTILKCSKGAVKCHLEFDCIWSRTRSHMRAGQTNLSETLIPELLPEVPLSGGHKA